MKRTPFLMLVFTLVLAACGARELTVSEAWARPALAGNNSAIYFIIQNPGEADTLLGAATTVAETVELHMSMMVEADASEQEHDAHDMEHSASESGSTMPQGEVMRMVKQENVPIPAGGKVSFQPGGLHVMLIGLNTDLVEGQLIQLTLTFEKAGEITLQVPVETR